MTQARERVRTAPPRRTSGKDGGPPGSDGLEVTASVRRAGSGALARQQIREIVADLAETAEEARRTARFVDITFRVFPDGATEQVVREGGGDALDVALAAAKARGQATVAEILRGEDMLNARDLGVLLGLSHETVNAKRKRFEILGLEGAGRGVRYPRWQVTAAGLPLPGLPRLFTALGEHPWTVYRFLRTAHPELAGRTALDALKAGEVDAVLGVAQNQSAGVFA